MKVDISRSEAEILVDILEGEPFTPCKQGYYLSDYLRSMFGMGRRLPI